jgi:hypothetical protein
MVLKVDANAYAISLEQFGWTTLGPIDLSSGKHEIQVSGSSEDMAELDVLWLLKSGANANSTDAWTGGQAPARLLSMTEIDPTKYVIELDADAPFMLQFSDAYDPAWSASFLGQSAKSMRLFGVANGFWINATGRVTVTVFFQPQLWFYNGLAISSASLLLCVAAISYSWWIRKGKLRQAHT